MSSTSSSFELSEVIITRVGTENSTPDEGAPTAKQDHQPGVISSNFIPPYYQTRSNTRAMVFERECSVPSLQDQLFADGMHPEDPLAFTRQGRDIDRQTNTLNPHELFCYVKSLLDSLECDCNERWKYLRPIKPECDCLTAAKIRKLCPSLSGEETLEAVRLREPSLREMEKGETVRVVEYLDSPLGKRHT